MEKDTPVCKTCYYMRMTRTAKITGNNSHNKGPRGNCCCEHPEAIQTFKRVCPRSPRMPGFIGFTEPGGRTPQIKTSPKWCPIRKENTESED